MSAPGSPSTAASAEAQINAAVQALQQGGVVAFPTDTLYGLGADVFNVKAVEAVFAVKERPEGMALPVLLDGWDQLDMVAAEVPDRAKALADRFWPGPLTLIVARSPRVPGRLTAGAPTVAVRVPDHPVPRSIARQLGRPVTGTSANLSGHPDPKGLAELRTQMGGRVDYLVTSGPPPQGTASTIVDITTETPALIREGAIPFDAVLEALG